MRVVIRVADRESIDRIVRLVERLGGRIEFVGGVRPYIVADVPPGAVSRIMEDPAVIRVEKVMQYSVQVFQTPRFFRGAVTPSSRIVEALGIEELWREGIDGRGVRVAVIDSGVADHPALRHAIEERIDLVGGPIELDHGTHVAGLIAAKRWWFGDVEIAGMAPKARIIDIRVVDSEGRADLLNVMKAIEIAIEKKVDVINMSLGSPFDCCFSTIRDLIAEAVARGILVVCSNGNYGPGKWTVACPAMVPEAIGVGSICLGVERDRVAWFSSRGPGCGGCIKPDVVAYGGCGDLRGERQPIEVIVSTSLNSGVAAHRGTSQAAPVFSGIAALIKQVRKDVDVWMLRHLLEAASIDLGVAGPDHEYGYGKPDPDGYLAMSGRITKKARRKIIASPLIIGALLMIVIAGGRR